MEECIAHMREAILYELWEAKRSRCPRLYVTEIFLLSAHLPFTVER